MARILGLDLGTNSIGWALIDDKENKIINTGVRIFQEGINRDTKGGELSKNETRRNARQLRKQYFRRSLRKKLLLKILKENQMCPIEENDFSTWIKMNPYKLRALAIHSKLSLTEIGRIFFHIAQRRGFKSSRKSGKEDGKIYSGLKESGTIGIDQTQENIAKGYHTLGEYLASIDPSEERLRNRYTTRRMYEQEFELIWDKQAQFHPKTFTHSLKDKLGYEKEGIIFYQRKLKSQKTNIGKCTLEPNKHRCPISTPVYEEFRTWQFINTIQYDQKRLSNDEREVASQFFFNKASFKFSELKKKLGLSEYNFNYDDDQKIPGTSTISTFRKLFTTNIWEAKTDKEKDIIWHIFFSAEDTDWLEEYAKTNWNFDQKTSAKLKNINLKQDYSNLSRKAINNILPFLKKGYLYNDAVVLGGIRNAIGGEKFDALEETEYNMIIDGYFAAKKFKNKEGELIELVKNFLIDHYHLNDKALKKLYHHSQDTESMLVVSKLPEPENLRNPIAQQAIFELRTLINKLIENYGKPDTINVEMARDLKSSKKQRDEYRFNQRRNQEKNDEARVEVEKFGLKPSRNNIQKYLLWKELEAKNGIAVCPYTGKTINEEDALGENNKFQIEHIIPYSVSLDDSFANKTLCDAKENQKKGDKTPYQFYGGDKKDWQMRSERAFKLLPYHKAKKFVSTKEFQLDDFIQRQLNDTRIISKAAKDYLKQLGVKVSVLPGQLTSELRSKWGLNNILNPEEGKKTRDDHRHHAIDALTVAATKQSFLQEMSKWNKYNKSYDLKDFPKPWKSFFEDTQTSINNVLVSYHKQHRTITKANKTIKKDGKKYKSSGISARGQLHKETVYGQHLSSNGEKYYHVRKPLNTIDNKAKVDKIVDPMVRSIIESFLRGKGINVDEKYKLDKDIFFKINEDTGQKETLIYLPNKNGSPIPVKKVRIKEFSTGAVKLKDHINQWVEPGNNHHISIYKNGDAYVEEVVTFWEAVERKKQGLPVINKTPKNGNEFECSLQINDLFLLNINEVDINWEKPDQNYLSKFLYRVQKLSASYYTFRHHLAATLEYKDEEITIQSFKAWKGHNPLKVKINHFGEISRF